MKEEEFRFLTLLGQLPARLRAEQVALVMNCQPHDVPVLVAARLLKPLGNPSPNSVKYFAALDILELIRDRSWLGKVTNTLNQHWRLRNERKNSRVVVDRVVSQGEVKSSERGTCGSQS